MVGGRGRAASHVAPLVVKNQLWVSLRENFTFGIARTPPPPPLCLLMRVKEKTAPSTLYGLGFNVTRARYDDGLNFTFCAVVLLCLRDVQCWNVQIINGCQEPRRNRVVVPARQATQPGGIGSSVSILGLLKSLKIRALIYNQDPRTLIPPFNLLLFYKIVGGSCHSFFYTLMQMRVRTLYIGHTILLGVQHCGYILKMT